MMTLYYHVYPEETILSFVFLPLIILLFIKRCRNATILSIIGLTGLIHFIGYSLLRVPPFHWYYAPQVTAIILLGSLGIGIVYQKTGQPWRQRVIAPAIMICFLIPLLGMFHILAKEHFMVKEMPVHSNWATQEQYKDIGSWLKEEYKGETIRLVAGEIGTLSYYCDCYLLDQFSDRSWLKDYVTELESKPGIIPFLTKINFTFYSAPKFHPAGYVLRAFSSEPDTEFEIIKKMETSTKWIKQGFMILSTR